MTLEQAWVFVESGGTIDKPPSCPPALFASLMLPCFHRDPVERLSFDTLAAVVQTELDSLATGSDSTSRSGDRVSTGEGALSSIVPRKHSSLSYSLEARLSTARVVTEVYTESPSTSGSHERRLFASTSNHEGTHVSLLAVSELGTTSGMNFSCSDQTSSSDHFSTSSRQKTTDRTSFNTETHVYIPVNARMQEDTTIYAPIDRALSSNLAEEPCALGFVTLPFATRATLSFQTPRFSST
jgi:hypothetical protein